MDFKRFSLYSLLCLASSSLFNFAHAAPLVSIGDNTDIYFNGSTSLKWSSNLFSDESDEVEDILYTISPGFEINVGRGLTNADFSVITRYNIRRYFDEDQLDTELFNIRAVGSYSSSRLDLSASVSYNEDKSAVNDVRLGGRQLDLVGSDSFDAKLSAEYRLSPKFSFGAGVSYSELTYASPFDTVLADRDTLKFPLNLFYELTPKVDLSAGYSYGQSDVDDVEVRPIDRDTSYSTDDHFFNIGARGILLPKLTGSFKIGYRQRERDNVRSSEDTLGLEADFIWVATPKLSSRLGLSRDFGVGTEGTSTEDTTVDISLNYALNAYYALTGFGLYTLSDYVSGREDKKHRLGAGLTYTPNEYWRFGADYTHSGNDSNRSNLDYKEHVISVSASLRY